jgi:hypothetical protein
LKNYLRGLARLGRLIIDHVYEVGFGQLSRILPWHFLGILEVLEESFLLGVEVNVLPEERVDLLPLVMLTESVHRSHFWALRDYSRQTNG